MMGVCCDRCISTMPAWILKYMHKHTKSLVLSHSVTHTHTLVHKLIHTHAHTQWHTQHIHLHTTTVVRTHRCNIKVVAFKEHIHILCLKHLGDDNSISLPVNYTTQIAKTLLCMLCEKLSVSKNSSHQFCCANDVTDDASIYRRCVALLCFFHTLKLLLW